MTPPPDSIGRYRVRELLGRGGFAEVWRARDDEFSTDVAIKILLERFAAEETVAERFVAEARLLRRIHHPNVVGVHDLGSLDDGRPYFVLDYAARGTLEQRLSPQPLRELSELEPLIVALADGLGALHDADVIHRDVKPANLLIAADDGADQPGQRDVGKTEATPVGRMLAPDERFLLGDLGLAKNLASGVQASVIGGTPGYQAPEQGSADGPLSLAADVFGASAVLYRVVTGSEFHGTMAVSDPGWARLFDRGLASDPGARHRSMVEWKAAALELAQGTSAVTTLEGSAWEGQCPYKGLAAFQPEDASLFHGRGTLVDELTRRIDATRVLVVGGPSGSGKSSVVRAGLVAALRERSGTHVRLMTPGIEPLEELAYQLSGITADDTGPSAEAIREQPRRVRRPVEQGLGPGEELVLVIDQFEELFTHQRHTDDRDPFIDALDALVSAADSATRVVLAMRADFYAAAATSPVLTRWISDNQVLVGPMTAEELRSAIAEPAHQVGLRLEPGLVERVLADAGEQAGALPLVSHALLETWRRRSSDVLTIADYQAVGGVAGAISSTAEALYADKFDDAKRRATRRLLLRLVTPGEGAADTRRRLPLDEIRRDVEAALQREVVDELSEARLLTLHDDHIEIAHEALIGTWPRLSAWIDEERDNLRHRQRISRAAAQWESADRDADLLYRGTPLASALDWAEENDEHLDNLERTFLGESRRARDEAVEAERARSAAARRVRIIGVAVLAVLAIAAGLASLVAFGALGDARDNQRMAEDRFGSALGSQAIATVRSDPYLAMNLALESAARSDPPDANAREALIESRRALGNAAAAPVGAPIGVGDALTVTLHPDERLVAVGGRQGAITLWDLVARKQVGPAERFHSGGINEMVFTPDGAALLSVAAGEGGGEIAIRPVGENSLGEPEEFDNSAAQMWSIDITPDGEQIVTSSEDGVVQVWDVATRQPVGGPLEDRLDVPLDGADLSAVNAVAFAERGSLVVTADDAGLLFGWAWPSRERAFGPIRAQNRSEAFELVIDDDGTVLIAGSNGTIETTTIAELSRAEAGSLLESGEDLDYAGVAYDSDPGLVLAGAADGAIHTANQLPEWVSAALHSAPIIDASLAGRTYVTLSNDQTLIAWSLLDPSSAPPVAQVVFDGSVPLRGMSVGAGSATTDTALIAVTDTEMSAFAGDENALAPIAVTDVAAVAADDGGVVVGSTTGSVVRIDSAGSTTELATLDAPAAAMTTSPDGTKLAVATETGDVVILDLDEPGATAIAGEPETTKPSAVTWSPDSSTVFVAGVDGHLGAYEASTGDTAFVTSLDDAIRSVAVSPDGHKLVAGLASGLISEIETDGGERTGRSYLGASSDTWALLYLDEGHTLIGGDGKATVHVWDVQTGDRLASLEEHSRDPTRSQNEVVALAAHPDRPGLFYSAGRDGTVRRWDMLDRQVACDLARPTFDTAQQQLTLGEGVGLLACETDTEEDS